MKVVYKDLPRYQHNVVLIHIRWSLYVGSITCTVYHWGHAKCGLYKQVVFRAGSTVFLKYSLCSICVDLDLDGGFGVCTCVCGGGGGGG